MARHDSDDGLILEVVEGPCNLSLKPRVIIPQTWWLRTSAADENAVCLREQVLAEFLVAVGLIEED